MSEHILEWLPAYHDGELPPGRRELVERHIQDCPSCRAELEALEGLSALLKADPAPQRTPPQRFAAQVQLRLPRTDPSRPSPDAARLPRWVLGTPLALLLVWAFLQAALWVVSVLLTADWAFSRPLGWIGVEDLAENLGTLLLLNAGLLVGAAVLWAAWMALWWAWQYNQISTMTYERLEKEL